MKKLIALIIVFAFSLTLAGMVSAEDARSAADKLESGRAYLKLLDQKIIRLRAEGKTALVKKMQEEKKGTIARMKAWKAEAEGAGMEAPTAPVAPVPAAPRPIVSRPAQVGGGLLGLGYDALISGGYIAASGGGSIPGVFGVKGDLVFADPFGLGPLVGLSEKDVQYRAGLGYAQGNGLKVLPVYIDGIINLPADLLGGIASYVGGGLNYGLWGNNSKVGRYGGELFAGIKGDLGLGLGGNTAIELGYSAVRSNTKSAKGITISVGQELTI